MFHQNYRYVEHQRSAYAKIMEEGTLTNAHGNDDESKTCTGRCGLQPAKLNQDEVR
jgi:hypothetical protein